jgi:urea carboxylase-associated protein 2
MADAELLGPDYYRARYATLKEQARSWSERRPDAILRGNPVTLPPDMVEHCETIPGGWYWSRRLARGHSLRIENTSGRSSVSIVLWNADDPSERLNVADSVKVQWTARLAGGRLLLSDMGRVLASITDDTYGHHDALLGGSSQQSNEKKYGQIGLRNTRDNLLLAAAKLGLGPRDVPPCVTFFAPVRTDAAGRFVWADEPCPAGAFVDLRAEMNLLVTLSNCPHPLDPADAFAPQAVAATVWKSPAPAPDDYCRTATEEAIRGFENTDPVFERTGG